MSLGEYLTNVGEVTTEMWVKATNAYMLAYHLIRGGGDKEARYVMEGYLLKEIEESKKVKQLLRSVGVSIADADKLSETIDKQVKNIVDCLK